MTGGDCLKTKRIGLAALLAAAVLTLCSCTFYIPFIDDESSSETTVTTTSKTERSRATTSKRSYVVEEDQEYTTTTRPSSGEDVDPDSFDRVSVSTTTKKHADISLTTTTTTTRSQYNTLQKPKSDQYYDITKQYRTSKETQLRFGPSKDYSAQLSLSAGSSLSCYGQSGKWYYVLYDNTTYGWVDEASLEGFDKKTTTKKK